MCVGCMVPFGMRVLHAELPHYLGKSQDALDRVCYIRAVIQRVCNPGNYWRGVHYEGRYTLGITRIIIGSILPGFI